MTIGDQITIERCHASGTWGLVLRGPLGDNYRRKPLTRKAVLDLIAQLNAASDKGAPWVKYTREIK